MYAAVAEALKTNEGQGFRGQACALTLGHTPHFQAEFHVVLNSHVRKERVVLKDSYGRALGGRH